MIALRAIACSHGEKLRSDAVAAARSVNRNQDVLHHVLRGRGVEETTLYEAPEVGDQLGEQLFVSWRLPRLGGDHPGAPAGLALVAHRPPLFYEPARSAVTNAAPAGSISLDDHLGSPASGQIRRTTASARPPTGSIHVTIGYDSADDRRTRPTRHAARSKRYRNHAAGNRPRNAPQWRALQISKISSAKPETR